MATYRVKLLKKEDIAEGTMSFHFEKPAGFDFKAGQNCDWFLIDPPEVDPEGNKRTFSLVSAPHEAEIQIASRMRDTAFKRSLKNMSEGHEIEMDGPYGDFTLQNDTSRPAVFLCGGIGITPFMSMLRRAAHDNLPHKIFLFFSNRRPEDAPFLTELNELQNKNPNFKFVPTMTDMAKSSQPWAGETGYVNSEMLKKYLEDAAAPIYYLAGPPGMVKAMREMLGTLQINDDNIRTEEFPGY